MLKVKLQELFYLLTNKELNNIGFHQHFVKGVLHYCSLRKIVILIHVKSTAVHIRMD